MGDAIVVARRGLRAAKEHFVEHLHNAVGGATTRYMKRRSAMVHSNGWGLRVRVLTRGS